MRSNYFLNVYRSVADFMPFRIKMHCCEFHESPSKVWHRYILFRSISHYPMVIVIVEVWGRDPWLLPIRHSHLVLTSVIITMGELGVVLHGGTSVHHKSHVRRRKKPYQLPGWTKNSSYYNVAAGIRISGLPNSTDYGYRSPTP